MIDRGENIALMEPVKLSETVPGRNELADMSFELAQASTALRSSLADQIVKSLADLVRGMNCYFSNLIEGHDTHPVDIERALRHDYSEDPKQRNLQLEAAAHMSVQHWIDSGGLDGGLALTIDGIKEIHRRFCEQMPDELLVVSDPDTGEQHEVIPGEFRERDVKVDRHTPVSPGAIPRFMQRFEGVFQPLGKLETTIAAAAIHHRFAWIHPFLDGNGRVSRLMSHAILRETLETGSIWSVSRGLARSLGDYKLGLESCDRDRQGDLDGRGNLSERALIDFTRYFLGVCRDQVEFMETLVQPDRLRERVLKWTKNEMDEKRLEDKSTRVMDILLYKGELSRREVPDLLGVSERQARRVVSKLIDREVVASETPRAPLHLAFPAALAHEWMPGLFPEKIN
jgi:Fic family protein